MEIIVNSLKHTYALGTPFERHALGPIDLQIPSGSFTAIIGQTGSGKSTLIQHFNGLLKPTSGEVIVGNVKITPKGKARLRDLRRKVGLLFQYPEYQLFEETVEKDISFGPTNFDFPPELIRTRVKEAMAFVKLDYETFKNQSPLALSGGQMRRVAMAGVLALKPEVVVLDEPTAGLDPQGKREILQRLYKLHKAENWTTILVTHNMEDAARYADRIIVMKDGGIALDGTPTEVFSREAELQGMGLDLPEITQFIIELNKNLTSPLPTNIFQIEELEKELRKRAMSKGGKR